MWHFLNKIIERLIVKTDQDFYECFHLLHTHTAALIPTEKQKRAQEHNQSLFPSSALRAGL